MKKMTHDEYLKTVKIWKLTIQNYRSFRPAITREQLHKRPRMCVVYVNLCSEFSGLGPIKKHKH